MNDLVEKLKNSIIDGDKDTFTNILDGELSKCPVGKSKDLLSDKDVKCLLEISNKIDDKFFKRKLKKVFFRENTEKLLELYSNNKKPLFKNRSCVFEGKQFCKDLFERIKSAKKIAEGEGGYVFSFKIPGINDEEFIMKIPREYSSGNNYCYTVDKIKIRLFGTLGITTKTRYDLVEMHDGDLYIPKNSYVCQDAGMSEFIIASLVGNEYEKGHCIHFSSMRSFHVCDNTSYTVMDKIKGMNLISFCTEQESTAKNIIYEIFMQVLCTIAFYQEKFSIVHYDLHGGNIMIEKISENDMFNGVNLKGVDYFHYKIKDKNIYIRNIGYIIKIIDFGLAIKWGKPLISSKDRFTEYTYVYDNVPNMQYDSYFVANIFRVITLHIFKNDYLQERRLKKILDSVSFEGDINNPRPSNTDPHVYDNSLTAYEALETVKIPGSNSNILTVCSF